MEAIYINKTNLLSLISHSLTCLQKIKLDKSDKKSIEFMKELASLFEEIFKGETIIASDKRFMISDFDLMELKRSFEKIDQNQFDIEGFKKSVDNFLNAKKIEGIEDIQLKLRILSGELVKNRDFENVNYL